MNFRSLSLLAALVLTLTSAAPAYSQSGVRPKGVAGIPFGATPEEAWRLLAARFGEALPEQMPYGEKFELTGGVFAGQEVLKWTMEFTEGKFSAASVVIKPKANAMSLYRELKQHLVSKYGPATGERKAPSAATDKKNLRRANDKDTFGIAAYWKFAPNLSDKEGKVIVCEATGPDGNEVSDEAQLQITIRYTNGSQHPFENHGGSAPGAKPETNPPVKPGDL